MINYLRKKYFKSEFLRNAFTLVTGVGIAQLIPILLQPILRRLFSPDDFGAFAVYMSLVGILTVVAMFRYQMAIVIPKDDDEAANIFFLGLILNTIFIIITIICIIIFKDFLIRILDFPEKYSYWLYFIPASVFLFCSYDAMNFWLIRKKAFKSSAINKVVRRSTEGTVQTIFSFLNYPVGLTFGDIILNVANNISGIIQVKKNGLSFSLFDKKKIIFLLKKYIDFPKNSIPALFNSAATLLPILFINKIYSENITGYFDLSRMVLAVPGILISTAIAQVLLQKLSEKKNKSLRIRKDLQNVFLVLVLIGIIEIIIILLFGPQLFTFVFGKNGTVSGVYSQILIYSYVFRFIISPFSVIFIALKKIKIISIWQSIYFLSILSLLFFDNLLFKDFLKVYVLIEIILYSFYFILILRTVKKYESGLNES